MMGRQHDRHQTLFYDFCLEDHVPGDHLLRKIAKVLDLSDVRRQLAPYYSRPVAKVALTAGSRPRRMLEWRA